MNALPVELRYPLQQTCHYMLDAFRFGTGVRAENGQFYRFESTTATVALTEFSIRHGQGLIPTQLFQVLPLDKVNAQIVNLQVSRAADSDRLYLKSPSTNAVFVVMVEF